MVEADGWLYPTAFALGVVIGLAFGSWTRGNRP